jgi:hypothetical protein
MKTLALAALASVSVLLQSIRAAMTVVDFEEYRGAGNRVSFPANFHGITFDADFGTWMWPSHSGDVAALSNRITEGWRECAFRFTAPDQRFVGAWVLLFSGTLEFRMYKEGKLVSTSATLRDAAGWTFLSSGYDGGVDTVGVWANRGAYGLDDITYTSIARPPAPRRAQAALIVSEGRIIGASITDPGFGYRMAPRVVILDASGSGANAVATITNNQIQSITITSGGQNYTSSALALVGLPDFVGGLKVGFSKIKVDMTLDIGLRYQLYSSRDLNNWTMVGEPFVADSDSKSVEFDVQPVWVYYQLRRLD